MSLRRPGDRAAFCFCLHDEHSPLRECSQCPRREPGKAPLLPAYRLGTNSQLRPHHCYISPSTTLMGQEKPVLMGKAPPLGNLRAASAGWLNPLSITGGTQTRAGEANRFAGTPVVTLDQARSLIFVANGWT